MARRPRGPVVPLDAAVRRAPDFSTWSHVDKIRFFCWHLQSNCGVAAVRPVDVARCYEGLRLEAPSSISPFFDLLQRKEPSEMSKDEDGCRLVPRVLDEFDVAYGGDPTPPTAELEKLAEKITDARRRKYFEEVLICMRAGAHRAAVTMAWNLAFDVLRDHVVERHRDAFGRALESSRNGAPPITVADGLSGMTERRFIEACVRASIISREESARLARRFEERDAAVRLASAAITRLDAEDLIRAAVEDVILRFA